MSTAARYAQLALLALPLLACNGSESSVSEGLAIPPSVAFGSGGGFFGGTTVGPDAGPPRLQELRTAAKTPPAISGGTLAVDGAGTVAVVADSDRDQIYVVDLREGGVRKIKLAGGSEPGRVALDGNSRAHVVLRGSGRLARIDLATATLLGETAVCEHPRGVALDPARARVVVTCMDGQLVQLEAGTHNEVARKTDLPGDLRDVLMGENGVEVISRYRSAELLRMTPEQGVKSRAVPRKGQRVSDAVMGVPVLPDGGVDFESLSKNRLLTLSPTLVWRTLRASNGNAWMLHQQSQDEEVVLSTSGGYGSGGCSTITGGKVSEVDAEGNTVRSMAVPLQGLSVDAALSPNQKWLAVASPGGFVRSLGTLQVFATEGMNPVEQIEACQMPVNTDGDEGQVTAVGFDDNNVLYAFSRDPAELTVYAEPNGVAQPVSGFGARQHPAASGVPWLGDEPHAQGDLRARLGIGARYGPRPVPRGRGPGSRLRLLSRRGAR